MTKRHFSSSQEHLSVISGRSWWR